MLSELLKHKKCGTQTRVAVKLAEKWHATQVDKNGKPYTKHLAQVALRVPKPTDDLLAIAVLHDILEDTPCTSIILQEAGIKPSNVAVIELLTRTSGSQDTYYTKIRENKLACIVKLADIADNTDPVRLKTLPSDTQIRLREKYLHALQQLGRDGV